MAKMRTLVCPECNGTFSYLQHPLTAPEFPRYCVLCGFDCESDAAPAFTKAITAPHVRDATTVKAVEYEYAAMEELSRQRAEQAAELTGGNVKDFSDLVVTDLKDNLREGDTAAPAMPVNDVSRAVAAAPNIWGFQPGAAPQGGQAPSPADYARNAHSGPLPFRGLQTGQNVRGFHGGWQDPTGKIAAPPVTDSPALEIINRNAIMNSPAARRQTRRH